MGGDGVERSRVVPVQQLLHGAFARIVSRQRQPPVFELAVEVLEVRVLQAKVLLVAQEVRVEETMLAQVVEEQVQ